MLTSDGMVGKSLFTKVSGANALLAIVVDECIAGEECIEGKGRGKT